MFDADHTLGSSRWPLVRLRARSETEVVLLSDRFFSLTTHWNGCTVPCPGDNCLLCETSPRRGLFYLAVGCDSRRSLLELASHSAADFEHSAKLYGGGMTPGAVFALSRRSDKSPIRSEFVRRQDVREPVDILDLARHVMAVFKFPPPNPTEDIEAYEKRCRWMAKNRTDRIVRELAEKSTIRMS